MVDFEWPNERQSISDSLVQFCCLIAPVKRNQRQSLLNVASYADSSNSWISWFLRFDPTNTNHAIRVGNSLFPGCCLNVALSANSSELQVILSDPANAINQQFVGTVLLFFWILVDPMNANHAIRINNSLVQFSCLIARVSAIRSIVWRKSWHRHFSKPFSHCTFCSLGMDSYWCFGLLGVKMWHPHRDMIWFVSPSNLRWKGNEILNENHWRTKHLGNSSLNEFL